MLGVCKRLSKLTGIDPILFQLGFLVWGFISLVPAVITYVVLHYIL